jgi:hypothetical protein
VTQQGVNLRHGDAKYACINGAAGGTSSENIVRYGDASAYAVGYNQTTNAVDIVNIDSGSTVYSTATSGVDIFTSLYFNNNLYVFAQSTYKPGVVFDGSSWNAINGTHGWSGTSFNPFGGDVYKNRAYLIQYNSSAYWFTGLSQVNGALDSTNDAAKIDLASIIVQKANLLIIAPITLADNVSAETFQAFVFANGEVLFYGGSYPNGGDWGLVGRAKIGQPLDYGSCVQYQGDSLVFCDSGVVSLRDLFLKGSEGAASLTVNTNIQKTWTHLVQKARTFFSVPVGPPTSGIRGIVKGIYDAKNDRIIIQFPYYLDANDAIQVGYFQFVFYNQTESWYFHQSAATTFPYVDMEFYNNKILLLSCTNSHIWVADKEGATGFADRNGDDSADVGYDFLIKNAPIPFPKNAVYAVNGIEPIIKSDLYAQTSYKLIADLGRQTTTGQTVEDQGTSIAKPLVNVGIEGTVVQMQVSGTTVTGKTVGLEFYGYNVWYESGMEASR